MEKNFFSTYNKDTHVGVFDKKNRMAKTISINELACSNNKKEDYYMSINSIKKDTPRCKKNVSRLQYCFADLDLFHEFDWNGLDAEAVYHLIVEQSGDEIPQPSFVIKSGRGLYFLWKLEDGSTIGGESIKTKKKWMRIQRELNSRLQDYCADIKICSDYSRLLRVPGSINSKTGTTVEIIAATSNTYSLYELDDILFGTDVSAKQLNIISDIENTLGVSFTYSSKRNADEFIKAHFKEYKKIKSGLATERQINFCKDIAKTLGKRMPKITYSYEADVFIKKNIAKFNEKKPKRQTAFLVGDYSRLYNERIRILEEIATAQNCIGKREVILFLYRYYIAIETRDIELALEKTLALNKAFSIPLKEAEVIHATKSAEKYFITQTLHISSERFYEMIGLESEKSTRIITKEEKSARNKVYYQKQLARANKLSKKSEVVLRREKIKNLIEQGKTDAEIMGIISISSATYYRDKKIIFCEEAKNIVKEIVKSARNRFHWSFLKALNRSLKNSACKYYKCVSTGCNASGEGNFMEGFVLSLIFITGMSARPGPS